jgi:hypothetical protein
MRYTFVALVAAALGLAIGLAAPHFRKPQSLAECLMERMKGQPAPMFSTVYVFCTDQQKAEMTDKDVGIDDWQRVTPAARAGN